MACNISSGRGYFCSGQVGGIKKVYLANFTDDHKIISVSGGGSFATDGQVTAITTKAYSTTTDKLEFYEFDLDRQLSSFNQTIVTGSGA